MSQPKTNLLGPAGLQTLNGDTAETVPGDSPSVSLPGKLGGPGEHSFPRLPAQAARFATETSITRFRAIEAGAVVPCALCGGVERTPSGQCAGRCFHNRAMENAARLQVLKEAKALARRLVPDVGAELAWESVIVALEHKYGKGSLG